jgi:predicted small lipoprotein YifL
MKLSRLLFGLVLLGLIAACGTKGALECPKGTSERPDGTCRRDLI